MKIFEFVITAIIVCMFVVTGLVLTAGLVVMTWPLAPMFAVAIAANHMATLIAKEIIK
jgi:hypothetical protein